MSETAAPSETGELPSGDHHTVGDTVVDREATNDHTATVINRPPVTCAEWDTYGDSTVAEDNPEHDADAEVVVVAFDDDLEREVPEWSGDEPLPLGETPVRFYAFPPSRLRAVGETRDESEALATSETHGPNDSDEAGEEAHAEDDQPTLDGYPALDELRERLEERSPVEVDVEDGEPTLVVEKLGVAHRIRPDGTISDGPLTARLRDVVDEYLGGGDA